MQHWIALVDDDVTSLRTAGYILKNHNMRVASLTSGAQLLDFIKIHDPDLIILDVMMPDMDGFETLDKLRSFERRLGKDETPVILLTSSTDNSVESRGFKAGVSDFIKKPYDEDILIQRIKRVLGEQEKLTQYKVEASIDKLTGLYNKTSTNSLVANAITRYNGYLLVIDLDSFKLVNDIYGHEKGDSILIDFSDMLKDYIDEDNICGRIGGDEFVMYSKTFKSEEDISNFTDRLNKNIITKAKALLGEDMYIPIGVSVGAKYIDDPSTNYYAEFKYADQALYFVKRSGKHGFSVYDANIEKHNSNSSNISLKDLSIILEERNMINSAFSLERDSFINVYRFFMRYVSRYRRNACKVLFSISPKKEIDPVEFAERCDSTVENIANNLRKSDLVIKISETQFFVLLTDIKESAVKQVIGYISRLWYENNADTLDLTYESEYVKAKSLKRSAPDEIWAAIVDYNFKAAPAVLEILEHNGIRASSFSSAEELFEFLENNIPDVILMSANMPKTNGYSVLEKLQSEELPVSEIPVIMMTDGEDPRADSLAFQYGAYDIMRKPFAPETLVSRIKKTAELKRLSSSYALDLKKAETELHSYYNDLISSICSAIDAKDTVSKEHAIRVAEYSKELARRFGCSEKDQDDIYLAALLHDLGKIFIPDELLNKPGKLTSGEFEVVKKHTVVGADVLKGITKTPKLALVSRWHHERYDGTGYPDRLEGSHIPLEARIVAVADAYDAMSSHRNYRKDLTQKEIAEEIKMGRGTQFDPIFADIMLTMISEDKLFKMRETSPDQ